MGEIRFVGTGETRGYPYLVCKKTFSMLNSVKHENLNTHKDKNIKKFGIF